MSFLGWLNGQPQGVKDFFGAAKTWSTDFPSVYKQYKRHPEVLAILLEGSLAGWPPEKIESMLAMTPYYQKTTEAQRDMDVLAIQKPAEYRKVMLDHITKYSKTANRLGLTASMTTGNKAVDTRNFLQDMHAIGNNKMTDDQIVDYLLSKYHPTIAGATGDVRNSMNDVRSLARDYALPMADDLVLWHGVAVQTGRETLDSISGILAKQARSMFSNPELTKAIDDGMTVREWADPYVQIAATTLEIGTDTIDLSKGKWQKFLKAPKEPPRGQQPTGQFRTMTLSEWQATLRTDQQYGFDKTENARQSASELTAALQEKFGVVG